MALLQYSKIAVKSLLLWVCLMTLGLIAVCINAYLALLANQSMTTLGLSLLMALMGAAYFFLANKAVLASTISRLLALKLSGDIEHRLAHRLAAKPDWMKAVGNAAQLKTALMQTFSGDSSLHAVLRWVIDALLSKIKLDQFPASADRQALPGLTAHWLIEQAVAFAAPSYRWFFMALLAHSAVLYWVFRLGH